MLSENMPHALVELGGLRGLLSRLQERPVRLRASGQAGERNHAVAVHMQLQPSYTPNTTTTTTPSTPLLKRRRRKKEKQERETKKPNKSGLRRNVLHM